MKTGFISFDTNRFLFSPSRGLVLQHDTAVSRQ